MAFASYEGIQFEVVFEIEKLEGWIDLASAKADFTKEQDDLFKWIKECEDLIFNLKALSSFFETVRDFKEYDDAVS